MCNRFHIFVRRYTKPQSFADCVGDELPVGWEESYDQIIGRYYINHFIRECAYRICRYHTDDFVCM